MLKERSLNRTQIKYIAIMAMLLDHTAAFLLPPEKYPALTVVYILMRTVGRIAAPVMFYFLAEGYHYTSSKLNKLVKLTFSKTCHRIENMPVDIWPRIWYYVSWWLRIT